jgi:MFS family permease
VSEPASAPRQGLAGPTIAGLLIAAAQAPLGSTMVAVALPSMSHELHEELSVVTTMVVTSYLVMSIVAQSPGGKLGDLIGHARTVRTGMGMYAIGAVVGLIAQGLSVIVVSRCLMAVGGALCVPGAIALLRIHVPRDRHGRVFGLVGATMGLSAAIGPPLGGELVSRFGWRGIFFAPLPFLATAAALTGVSPPPRSIASPRSASTGSFRGFDGFGTVLFSVGLAALVAAPRLDGGRRLACLAVSFVSIAAFVLWELRAPHPVFDPRLFRNKEFAVGSSVMGLQNFAMYGLIFELPQLFERIRGSTAKEVGHVLFFMMSAMFATATVGGRLTDRFGARTAALLGAVPMLAGMLWMQWLDTFQVPRDAIMPLLLLGVGMGLIGAPTQSSAMSTIPLDQSGMAAGATSTLRYLGGVLSIFLLSTILGGNGAALIERHVTAAHAFGTVAVIAAVMCLFLPGRDRMREMAGAAR